MNSNKSKFQTLVILDLETTGLVYDKPKITELAMIAIHISTLDEMKSDEELPRILNKFVKFFDPGKEIHSKAKELSNLDNHMLRNYSSFNRETVIAMENFLNDFQKPLCFVAHNGNIFDFPILFNEIQTVLHINDTGSMLNEDSSVAINHSSLMSIDCVDSINFFREIYRLLNDGDNNILVDLSLSPVSTIHRGYVEIPLKSDITRQLPSLKLIKIYEREFDRISNLKSHRAEDDCLMLLAILKRYLPDWIEWMNVNYRPLSNFSYLPSITSSATTTKPPPKNNIKVKRPLKF